MSTLPEEDRSRIREQVQRTAGIAALRRLRRMVDAWNAEEQFKGTMARRVALVVGALVLLGVLLLVFAPETLRSAARALSAIEPAGRGALVARVERAERVAPALRVGAGRDDQP